jgi:hypothetical protein
MRIVVLRICGTAFATANIIGSMTYSPFFSRYTFSSGLDGQRWNSYVRLLRSIPQRVVHGFRNLNGNLHWISMSHAYPPACLTHSPLRQNGGEEKRNNYAAVTGEDREPVRASQRDHMQRQASRPSSARWCRCRKGSGVVETHERNPRPSAGSGHCGCRLLFAGTEKGS